MIRRKWLAGVALMACGAVAAQRDFGSLAREAVAAARGGDFKKALELSDEAVRLDPKRREGYLLRAQVHELRGDYLASAADCGQVLKQDPKDAGAWQKRGEAHFKAGKFAESVKDFDGYLALNPDERPHHWQRGISLYYAGRFKDGKHQFEIHQTVNSNDVENAVWHFLCATRADGLESARKHLIPITGDSRVPMAEVHRLFAGKAAPKDVLAAAEAAPPVTRAGEPLFYAHLYLGIYYEALGEKEKAREHIVKSAERWRQNGYMGHVARVHADVLKKAR